MKIQTESRFTPYEFRKLNKCLICARAVQINYGGKCDSCNAVEYKHCRICEIILRTGEKTIYAYDIRGDYRGDSFDFKANKQYVQEFKYTLDAPYPQYSDELCTGCKDYKLKIKNGCWVCGVKFENTEENYKENGNTCDDCAVPFTDEIWQKNLALSN